MHFTNHGHNWFVGVEELKTWYSHWNKRISPFSMSILGGEPLLHKDLIEIIYLTKEMWQQPKREGSYFELVTNGLLLDKELHKDLPKALKDTNCILSLSIHSTPENEKYAKKLNDSINLLNEWKKTYDLNIVYSDMYHDWYKSYNGYGINSEPFEGNDPDESWKYCRTGQNCFQLYKENIYKCCMTAYLSLQKEKYGDMLSKKWNPYLKYVPLKPGCTDEEIVEFFNRKAESVCAMCPNYPEYLPFQKNDPLISVSFYENMNKNKILHKYF